MVPGHGLLVSMGAVAMALQSRKISGLIRIKHRFPEDQAPLTRHLSGVSARPGSALREHTRVPREQLGKGSRRHGGGLSAGPLQAFLAGKQVCLQTEPLHIYGSPSFQASLLLSGLWPAQSQGIRMAPSSPYQILPTFICTGSRDFVSNAAECLALHVTDPQSFSNGSG